MEKQKERTAMWRMQGSISRILVPILQNSDVPLENQIIWTQSALGEQSLCCPSLLGFPLVKARPGHPLPLLRGLVSSPSPSPTTLTSQVLNNLFILLGALQGVE